MIEPCLEKAAASDGISRLKVQVRFWIQDMVDWL